MALRRKKRFSEPVACSRCKEKKAYHTMHGGFIQGNGKTICDDCYPLIQMLEREEIEKERKFQPSEADYQTWMRL